MITMINIFKQNELSALKTKSGYCSRVASREIDLGRANDARVPKFIRVCFNQKPTFDD
jgi:hypothetical protein